MAFTLGQKVVCIDAANTHTEGVAELTEGSIYTIAWVGHWRDLIDPDVFHGVCVAEIPERQFTLSGLAHKPFCVARFRPVVSLSTDISIFTRMLTPETVA